MRVEGVLGLEIGFWGKKVERFPQGPTQKSCLGFEDWNCDWLELQFWGLGFRFLGQEFGIHGLRLRIEV